MDKDTREALGRILDHFDEMLGHPLEDDVETVQEWLNKQS